MSELHDDIIKAQTDHLIHLLEATGREDVINKAIDNIIEKGGARGTRAKVGEIRMYGDKPYRKEADGSWTKLKEGAPAPKTEEVGNKTRSGKEIHPNKFAGEYPDFTKEDHEDAIAFHDKELRAANGPLKKKSHSTIKASHKTSIEMNLYKKETVEPKKEPEVKPTEAKKEDDGATKYYTSFQISEFKKELLKLDKEIKPQVDKVNKLFEEADNAKTEGVLRNVRRKIEIEVGLKRRMEGRIEKLNRLIKGEKN